MKTVIYLSNQQIQIITGDFSGKKISLSSSIILDAPDGCIINGIIMDTEAFVSFVKEVWAQNNLSTKNVTLVANSSKFVSKTIEMPILSDSKTLEFVEREFSDIKKNDDDLFGYVKIGSVDGNQKVYAECVPSDMISDYKSLFEEAGVSLSEIYSGESSLIEFIGSLTKNIANTFVFQIADRMTITTVLWVNGAFYYLNSVRSFYDQGTEDYANDVARSVSQIVQFMQAHQIEYSLETVLIAGLPVSDGALYQQAISQQGINVPVRMFDSGVFGISGKASGAAYMCTGSLSGLISRDKKQNYLRAFANNNKKSKRENGLFKDFLLVGIIFGVMVIACLTSFVFKVKKNNEYKKIKEYNQNIDVLSDVKIYEKLSQRNAYLLAQYNEIIKISDNIETYPVCNSQVMNVVTDCAGRIASVKFESYDSIKGIITFSAKCSSVDNINLFVKALIEREEFYSVDYTGYSYNANDDTWDVHVTCILGEGVGRK